VRGIQAGLQPASYLPLVMDAQTQRGLFDNYLQMILERRAEGVIVIASWVFDETNLLSDIEKNNVPIVIVSRDLPSVGSVPCWWTTKREAYWRCATWSNWAIAGSRSSAVRRTFRQRAALGRGAAGAAKAGIKLDKELVLQLPSLVDPASGFEGGLDCARRMLASGKPFTAVLAFDDLTAPGRGAWSHRSRSACTGGLFGAGL